MDPETPEARLERVVQLLSRGGPVNEDYVAPEVEEAARGGSGRAALLASMIAGSGFGRERNWAAALDWLGIAAERGVEEARAQLAFLAGGADERPDWRAVAARVDVAAWTAPRAVRVVVERPRIGVAEGFIDAAFCAWLIERARPLQTQARVYDYVSGRPVERGARTNSEATFTLLELDLPILLLRERIAGALDVPWLNLERTSIFRYLAGQTFAPHADYLDPSSTQLAKEVAVQGQRIITFLIYLNEAFEGGETHFLTLGKRLRGRAGDALFFHNVDEAGAPDPATEHEGAPPTRGEKWLLSQFIRDRPQLPG